MPAATPDPDPPPETEAVPGFFRRAAPPPPDPDDLDEPASSAPAPPDPDPDDGLPPGRMRGTERLYGIAVGVELLVVAVLNLTIQGGAGAPKSPDDTLMVIGVAGAALYLASLALRHRTVAAFGAIIAAYLVTLPRVPNRLSVAHLVALLAPVIYGLLLAQRQRKAAKAAVVGRPARTRSPRGPAPERRPSRTRSAPARSRPSGRYTPPKPKRAAPGRRGR
jgi:hypothetical protein